jgi:MAP kinase interacting serine/threonine kinase
MRIVKMTKKLDNRDNTPSKDTDNDNTTPPPARRRKKKKRLCSSLSVTQFCDVYRLTGETLGEGSYGKVEECENIVTKAKFAVKIISKSNVTFSRAKMLKEIELYFLCQGVPEIIQLIEYFEESEYFYLVFEKAKGGPLLTQIQRRVHFTEQEAASIIRDLAAALAHLHSRGIAHRDVKPENVLCYNDGENGKDDFLPVKLCDFDLCSSVYESITTPKLQSPVGSVEYMAPEVVEAFSVDLDFFGLELQPDNFDEEEDVDLTYDKRCDLWSLGIIAYILLCGYLPFSGRCGKDCGWEDRGEECFECQHQLFQSIKSGSLIFPEKHWSTVSKEAKDLTLNY